MDAQRNRGDEEWVCTDPRTVAAGIKEFLRRTEAIFELESWPTCNEEAAAAVRRVPSEEEFASYFVWSAEVLNQVAECFEWRVRGVAIPQEVMKASARVPRNQRRSHRDGIRSIIAGLTSQHPRLARVLEVATARREEGMVLAEEGRERRDARYRERLAFVSEKYGQVRCKYAEGSLGDKAARLEVAVAYERRTGDKRMCDRTVRNLLAASAKHIRDRPSVLSE
jgi:hypothetical protein